MVLSRAALPERVGGEGRGWGMACGARTASGVQGSAGGGRGRNQDVLSCYLANTSSGLVSVARFCCRARQLRNSKEIKFSLQSNRFFIPALSQHAAGYLLRQQMRVNYCSLVTWSGKLAIKLVQTAQVSDVFFSPVSPEIKGEPGVRNTTVC